MHEQGSTGSVLARIEPVTDFGTALQPLVERMFTVMYEAGEVRRAAWQQLTVS